MLLNQILYKIQQTKLFKNDILNIYAYIDSIYSHKIPISAINYILELYDK